MKQVKLTIAAAALLFATSCGNAPDSDQVTAGDAIESNTDASGATLTVDNAATAINWRGRKPVGDGHVGTLALKDGSTVTVENNKVTGGNFIFDFNTLTPTDQDEEGNGKLKGHLLAPDFLDVAQFPEGNFEIITVTEGVDSTAKLEGATHTVTGNLTLKGITKSISFPAKINVTDNKVTTDAEFNFIRTDWNINYMSDASIKDKFINKEIELKLHVEANKL